MLRHFFFEKILNSWNFEILRDTNYFYPLHPEGRVGGGGGHVGQPTVGLAAASRSWVANSTTKIYMDQYKIRFD